MSKKDMYYFEILNPADGDECIRYAPGYPVIIAEGRTEQEARQAALARADEEVETLQYAAGERLGRVVRINDRWLIKR
jgi:hypothetical protein